MPARSVRKSAGASLNRSELELETRRRLLDSAGEAFAENGFHGTTIREICRRAGANVAAVNYHFRDKDELYQQVFENSACIAQEHFSPETRTAMAPGNPPRQRLHAFIRQFLQRMLSPGRPAWQGKLMAREMMDPTAALDHIVKTMIRPNSQLLGEIVSDITGLPPGDPRLWLTAASIVAQCLFYTHCKPVIIRLRPDLKYDQQMIEDLTEHITSFSWAALAGAKQRHARSPRKKGGRP
ncbi:MAG TPA: CerR family C-terminal domain-containing protein [Phycisphaerae bacterium]|nr:CerR family C-terminal domain-containing protein [Phycisphaerae bacterium]